MLSPTKPSAAAPPVMLPSGDPNPPPDPSSSLQPLDNNQEEAQPSTSYYVQDNVAAPSDRPHKRTRSSSKYAVQEQSFEDMMCLKYKEHELAMKIKDTDYQCSEMEKELKIICKKITMIDNEVKEMQLQLCKLAIRNKELQYETLKKEMENANEKGRVIRLWGDAAVAVHDAAKAFTETVKCMNR